MPGILDMSNFPNYYFLRIFYMPSIFFLFFLLLNQYQLVQLLLPLSTLNFNFIFRDIYYLTDNLPP